MRHLTAILLLAALAGCAEVSDLAEHGGAFAMQSLVAPPTEEQPPAFHATIPVNPVEERQAQRASTPDPGVPADRTPPPPGGMTIQTQRLD